VIETPHGRIGLAVCYDIEFPELTRGLALRGAELIVIPANWPRDDDPPDGRPILHPLTSMTAYFNKVFVAVCDRHGTERGGAFEGASVIAGPTGAILAASFENRGAVTLQAELDLRQARDKRTSHENDAFGDRRAEHYDASLIEPAQTTARTT
jgi:predicted amidohydrolase